ncbi:hypothetical protein DV736_g5212, partial [Chaetothyriales sp. CBS 134916]
MRRNSSQHESGLWQTLSRRSTYSERQHEREIDDPEANTEHPFTSRAEDWELYGELRDAKAKLDESSFKNQRLGVTWNNLTVYGAGGNTVIHEDVLSQFNVPRQVMESRHAATGKTILDNVHGCVKPGEMLLVLGRPGAGCTTLLRLLSNQRHGYTKIDGDVHFGSLNPDQAKKYRSSIVMNTEDEVFYPTLTVGQTIDFATRLKIPYNYPSSFESPQDYQQKQRDFLLRSMGIAHTEDTKVGNEYVRGVSGGERKRVSIIECLATRASVFCWDNSTRGLDASTALEWTKAIRALTDVTGSSSIVTLYQAGNGIFNLFDKVLGEFALLWNTSSRVLDEGKEIYYGPMKTAVPFMESLGFYCDDAANVADYLTGVTVPSERQILPGFDDRFPRTADEIRTAYQKSDIRAEMESELNYYLSDLAKADTEEFCLAKAHEKHKSLPKSSSLTVSFRSQLYACVVRQYQIIWGDKASFIIKQGSTIIQALIAGSLFYAAPDTSAGLFPKGGALFFALLYNSLLAMSEVTDSFSGRPVLAKQKQFGFFNPAAFCLAQIAADIPVLFFQVSIFSVILYFMVGLKTTAAAFFTFWVVVYSTTMCMTALFRLVGAAFSTFDGASKVSGLLVAALVTYTGYMIPKTHVHDWFVWIFWIDPLAYAFEAIMANEFHGKDIPCVSFNLVPNGPAYADTGFQSCAGVGGALPGQGYVTGDAYLNSLSYSHSHLWRNFGIVWAWWFFFAALTIFFTAHWKDSSEAGVLLVPRSKVKKQVPAGGQNDLEKQSEKMAEPQSSSSSAHNDPGDDVSLVRNTSVFTWKNLSYTVTTPSGDRVLLDNVQGWVKPGMLGALMGSSGAGKTTLLDVLAQRKTEGKIQGSVMVDGRPLSASFQRSVGYCEQFDVHESYATVREALMFSALLRQNRNNPKAEKLHYVETVIDLLELRDIEHCLIGQPGAGLSVEQRKRVTIGVELVAKPDVLIFLDEPTSGLDGQAAYNTLRFLKKLAAAGQAVLVTIHQPSAQLFSQFDTLLLLAKGGKTVYFGDIGKNAATIKDYFARNGAPCPNHFNPAEHMIDVVSGSLSQGKDWNRVWLESAEHAKVQEELDQIISDAQAKPLGYADDGHEFATPLREQIKLVTDRMNLSLSRNTDYINNKFALHVFSALFNGFTFWQVGHSIGDLQLILFTVFNFIFVAPGVMAQLQPLFISRRDIFEVREKKSKMYNWVAFTTALVVSEIPYLLLCGLVYFVCWYWTVGFPNDSNKAGAVLFVMLMYEFVYTGIGQFVAAYAPNAVFASLINPLLLGTLISFCGVLMPYAQIQAFWRYWMYYLNPFTYLMGSLMVFPLFQRPVECKEHEFSVFDPPANQSCGGYLAEYLSTLGARANLTNPDAVADCRVCQYRTGSDYLYVLNLKDYYYGWRDAAIVVLFAISSYAMVYLMMRLRTKQAKKADN